MFVAVVLLAGLGLPVVGWGAPSPKDQTTITAFMEQVVGLNPDARAGLGKKGIACFADGIASTVSKQEMTSLGAGAKPSPEVTSAVIGVMFDCALIGRMISMAVSGDGHHLSGRTIRCLDKRVAEERQILTSAFTLVATEQPTTPEMDAARALILQQCLSEKEMAAITLE
jgi:hypothetical protein